MAVQTLLIALTLVTTQSPKDSSQLRKNVAAEFAKHKGTYGFAFKDLETGEAILINAKENFHAASTMKTPVLIEAFKQAAEGKFNLNDSVVVYNQFKSIIDGSTYSLATDSDTELDLYKMLGRRTTIKDLLHKMITKSSNLATNIIIDLVGAKSINPSMRRLGAMDVQVLRGVEDSKAYRAGKNNTVTASDLMLLFEKLGRGEVVSSQASEDMIGILSEQHFRDVIPAKLPRDIKVANKTGFITGVIHDSGIVYLPDGRKYVLILLSKNVEDKTIATETLASVSLMVYKYVMNKR